MSRAYSGGLVKDMDVRTWLAGMQMQGLISNPQISPLISKDLKEDAVTLAAIFSVKLADALLKELEK